MQTWVETFAAAAGAFLFVLVCVLLLVFSAVLCLSFGQLSERRLHTFFHRSGTTLFCTMRRQAQE